MNNFIYGMIVGANIGLVGMYLYNAKMKNIYLNEKHITELNEIDKTPIWTELNEIDKTPICTESDEIAQSVRRRAKGMQCYTN